jgi:YcaO-like protein with predicted kinase domain
MTIKAFTAGTHRAVSPAETIRRVSPMFDRCGITRVADITGLDRIGIPVAAAYRPLADSLAVSMGKGVTTDAARASALMESIELWHAERPTVPVLWGAACDLERAHDVVDWARLPRLPRSEFQASTPTAWVEARSMTEGTPTLVPYEAVSVDGRVPAPRGSGWFVCTSNGLASGNNVAEAKLHAFCEVIERDATTLWRLGGDRQKTAVDLDTVPDSCRGLLDRFHAAGMITVIHNTTSDIGVAAFQCTVFEKDPRPEAIVYATSGLGCHPSSAVALSRAITEAAQSRLALISGARDDMFRRRYDIPDGADEIRVRLIDTWRTSTHSPQSFEDVPDVATSTIEGDLEAVIEALSTHNLHAFWVDLSQRDIEVAVGRAVVPGLELLDETPDYSPGERARAAGAVATR